MILYEKLDPRAKAPTKDRPTDAGYDLYCLENIIVPYGSVVKVRTGLAILVPEGYCAVIEDRSGRGGQGLHKLAGVIDQYTGEWIIIMTCLHNDPTDPSYSLRFEAGSKIAQFLVHKVHDMPLKEVDKLPSTDRGDKGFGSSG